MFGTFNNTIFNRMHRFLVFHHVLYYDSLQNYQDKVEPSLKRKLMYHCSTLLVVSGLIKSLLLSYYNDEWIRLITGEVVSVFLTRYQSFYGFAHYFITLFIIIRLFSYYYEKSLMFDCSKLVLNIQDSNRIDTKILQNDHKSLLILANSMYWGGKLLFYFELLIASTGYISLTLLAYFDDHNKFNAISLIIATIQITLGFYICFSTLFGVLMLVITMGMYLKWKQDEIIKSIRFNLIWRNKVRLYNNLRVYHSFTKTFDKVSKPINMLIGMLYSMTPGIFSQIIMMVTKQSLNNEWETIVMRLTIILIIFFMTLVYIINHLCTSITTANQSIVKSLYKVFNDQNFNRLTQQSVGLNLNYNFGQLSNILVHMKIDSFIARLNEEYIGFYCFNLFPFTKLAYFQYLYIFMTSFVLIYDLK